jgi:hypothetical protein
VAISGNLALVGAYLDDVGANSNQGSVSWYQYDGSSWVFLNKMSNPTGATEDLFGTSVSLSGDYLIVGSPGDDVGANNSQGSVTIYKHTAGFGWQEMQKITDANGLAGDQFGFHVSISGNCAIVGAYQDDVGTNTNQGSASIYIRVGYGWGKVQYVTDPMGNASDQFGKAVGIDPDTRRFLIGADAYGMNGGKVVFGKIH